MGPAGEQIETGSKYKRSACGGALQEVHGGLSGPARQSPRCVTGVTGESQHDYRETSDGMTKYVIPHPQGLRKILKIRLMKVVSWTVASPLGQLRNRTSGIRTLHSST